MLVLLIILFMTLISTFFNAGFLGYFALLSTFSVQKDAQNIKSRSKFTFFLYNESNNLKQNLKFAKIVLIFGAGGILRG